jgi:L-amino acid N-acyltransferase YncA
MLIRHAEPARDAGGCLAIYAPYVVDSAASFEEERPTLEEFRSRIETLSRTHAYLVAEDDERIAGYVYACPHRNRPGYRWTVEASIYVDPEYQRRGLGRALYTPLLELIARQGYRIALAAVRVPNPGSVSLHTALGFEPVGTFRRIGWTAGAWQDVMWLSKALGPETLDTAAPPDPGPPVRLAAPIML